MEPKFQINTTGSLKPGSEIEKTGSLKIIGTAHVSKESIEEVKSAILEEKPDVVAVELDLNRYTRLLQEKSGEVENQEVKVRDLIKGDQVTMFLVGGFLSYMQKKIGDEVGVKPGSEMMAAIEAAEEVGARVALIDRDIQITLRRALNKMSIWEKLKFVFGLIASLFSSDEAVEDIEKIKEGDTLAEVMEYFEEMSPKAFDVLVTERDAYMARMLLDIPQDQDVVAVVGAGHQKGIKNYMSNPEKIPPINELLNVQKRRISISKVFFFIIPVIFLAVFVFVFVTAFLHGINLKMSIFEYILITSSLSFAGCILSGSKIPSALLALVLGPLSVLHVLPAVGFFSGYVEAKMRKVGTSDIMGITECEKLGEFWQNNFFRVLMVVIGTNIGASIGFFLTIPNVILPLVGKILGSG